MLTLRSVLSALVPRAHTLDCPQISTFQYFKVHSGWYHQTEESFLSRHHPVRTFKDASPHPPTTFLLWKFSNFETMSPKSLKIYEMMVVAYDENRRVLDLLFLREAVCSPGPHRYLSPPLISNTLGQLLGHSCLVTCALETFERMHTCMWQERQHLLKKA